MANPNPIPPEEHKFKPGESGNPEGRPKGSRNLSTILREMLEEEIEVNIDGKKEKKQFKDVIIRKLVKKANDGNLRAIQEIFDRTEGKAKQKIEHEGLPEPAPIHSVRIIKDVRDTGGNES